MTGLQKLSQKIESQNTAKTSTFAHLSNLDNDSKRAMIEALRNEVKSESADTRNAALASVKGEW